MRDFRGKAAIFDLDHSTLDGNAGLLFTRSLYLKGLFSPAIRKQIPGLIYRYVAGKATEAGGKSSPGVANEMPICPRMSSGSSARSSAVIPRCRSCSTIDHRDFIFRKKCLSLFPHASRTCNYELRRPADISPREDFARRFALNRVDD